MSSAASTLRSPLRGSVSGLSADAEPRIPDDMAANDVGGGFGALSVALKDPEPRALFVTS